MCDDENLAAHPRIRPQTHGLLGRIQSLGIAPGVREALAPTLESLRGARPQVDDMAVGLGRLGEVLSLGTFESEPFPRLRQGWIEFDSPGEVPLCAGPVLVYQVDNA